MDKTYIDFISNEESLEPENSGIITVQAGCAIEDISVPSSGSGSGTIGTEGPPGPIGPQGNDGEVGSIGPVGPRGTAGVQGIQGAIGPVGSVGSTGGTGQTGAVGLQGQQGIQGIAGQIIVASQSANLSTGVGVPLPALGVDSDLYIDISTQTLYGPKANNAWPTSGIVLTGPVGPQGIPGSSGASGAVGPQGATGVQGATGPVGPQGLSGTGSTTSGGTQIITEELIFENATGVVNIDFNLSGRAVRFGDNPDIMLYQEVDGIKNYFTDFGSSYNEATKILKITGVHGTRTVVLTGIESAAPTSGGADLNALHRTGDETKTSGILTFIQSPIVPIATQNNQAVQLGQIAALAPFRPDGIVTVGALTFDETTDIATITEPFVVRYGNIHYPTKNAPNNIVQLNVSPIDYGRMDLITCDIDGNYYRTTGPNVYTTMITPPTPEGHTRLAIIVRHTNGSSHVIMGKPVKLITNTFGEFDDEVVVHEGRDFVLQAAPGAIDTGDFIFKDGNGVERARIYLAPGPQKKFFVRFGINQPSYELPLGPTDTTLISGGEATSSTGTVTIASAIFRIEGVDYTSVSTILISPAANADFLRIDAVIGNKDSSVTYLTGVAGESAIPPTIPMGSVLIRYINKLAGLEIPEIQAPPATIVSVFEKLTLKHGPSIESTQNGCIIFRSKRGNVLMELCEEYTEPVIIQLLGMPNEMLNALSSIKLGNRYNSTYNIWSQGEGNTTFKEDTGNVQLESALVNYREQGVDAERLSFNTNYIPDYRMHFKLTLTINDIIEVFYKDHVIANGSANHFDFGKVIQSIAIQDAFTLLIEQNFDPATENIILRSTDILTSYDYSNITRIANQVDLGRAPNIVHASFPNLVSVNKYFDLWNLPSLQTASAPLLQKLSEYFEIYNLPLITSASFPSLKTINGSVYIYDNTTLVNLNLLALESIMGFYFAGSLSLTELNLPSLRTINDFDIGYLGLIAFKMPPVITNFDMGIAQMPNLVSLDLSNPLTIDDFSVKNNPLLTTIDISGVTISGNVGNQYYFGGNALNATTVNNILILLNQSKIAPRYAAFDGGTNAYATGAGLIAAQSLVNKGWTIGMNGPLIENNVTPGIFLVDQYNRTNDSAFRLHYTSGSPDVPVDGIAITPNGTTIGWHPFAQANTYAHFLTWTDLPIDSYLEITKNQEATIFASPMSGTLQGGSQFVTVGENDRITFKLKEAFATINIDNQFGVGSEALQIHMSNNLTLPYAINDFGTTSIRVPVSMIADWYLRFANIPTYLITTFQKQNGTYTSPQRTLYWEDLPDQTQIGLYHGDVMTITFTKYYVAPFGTVTLTNTLANTTAISVDKFTGGWANNIATYPSAINQPVVYDYANDGNQLAYRFNDLRLEDLLQLKVYDKSTSVENTALFQNLQWGGWNYPASWVYEDIDKTYNYVITRKLREGTGMDARGTTIPGGNFFVKVFYDNVQVNIPPDGANPGTAAVSNTVTLAISKYYNQVQRFVFTVPVGIKVDKYIDNVLISTQVNASGEVDHTLDMSKYTLFRVLPV